MKLLQTIAFLLLIVGGLNWGLIGLSWLMNNNGEWNVVHMLFGSSTQLEAIVYVLVGLSAVWVLVSSKGKLSV